MTGRENGIGSHAARPDEGQRAGGHGSDATSPVEPLQPVLTSDGGASGGDIPPPAPERRRTLGAVIARIALVVVGSVVGFILATMIGLVTGVIPVC
jgi:hypothetical protein